MLAIFLANFIMAIGLFSTVSVTLSGTVIIFAGAGLYGLLTGFITFSPWTTGVLLLLVIAAEGGGRVLRVYVTRNYPVSRAFSVNSTVSHVGGLLACDALLGPVAGLVVWELLAGKTLLPRGDSVFPVLLRLSLVAALRFVCGMIMILYINIYIFI